jgi:hypothetical protein
MGDSLDKLPSRSWKENKTEWNMQVHKIKTAYFRGLCLFGDSMHKIITGNVTVKKINLMLSFTPFWENTMPFL